MERAEPSVRVSPAARLPVSARLVVTLGRLAGTRASAVFSTIARNRRLSRWWLPFAGTVLLRGRLPRADTELVVLRTAWNCAGWYEWVQHAPLARRAGLDEAAVAAVALGAEAGNWSGRQALLLRATDELCKKEVISDTTWRDLVQLLDPEECIELCFLVGHYAMVGATLNSLGVRPEDDALDQLDASSAALARTLRRRLVDARAPVP